MRKTICILAAMFMIFSLTSALAWGENNAELYENAIGLLKESKYAEAAQAFADLEGYSDAPRYTMYCNAMIAGEAGMYSAAVKNFSNLDGFSRQ